MKRDSFADDLFLSVFSFCLIAAAGCLAGLCIRYVSSQDIALSWLYGVALLSTLGFLFPFLHLGRKMRSVGALKGLSSSWLSREIGIGSLFLVGCWALVWCTEHHIQHVKWIWICQGILAVALLWVIGMVYHLVAQPMWFHGSQIYHPLVVGLFLAAAICFHEVLLLIPFWIADSGFALIRLKRIMQFRLDKARVFPDLYFLFEGAFILRVLVGLLGLGLAFQEVYYAAGPIVFCILLDRFSFYGTAVQIGPSEQFESLRQKAFAKWI